MAENLVYRGFDATLIEMIDQVLPPLYKEQTRVVESQLKHNGVKPALSFGVAGFKKSENDTLEVETKSDKKFPADLVILALEIKRISILT